MTVCAKRKERTVRFLPIGLDVKGRPVLVVGGGKVALQKLRTILLFDPQVTVLSPEILPEIEALPVTCVYARFSKTWLKKMLLVYACTSDRRTNRRIAREASAAGILCNVADDTDACVFISPAVHVAGDLIVTVNSQGRNPKLAREARDFVGENVHDFLRCRH